MERVTHERRWPLHDAAAGRRMEQAAAASLAPHTLMQRAGLAVARLALALAPNARTFWIPCGPGNNGGDGMEAAMHLKSWGRDAVVTWLGNEDRLPPDAKASHGRAKAQDVSFALEVPAQWDFAIDAMLGLGSSRPLEGAMASWSAAMCAQPRKVLAVDVPSGLNSDTGSGESVHAAHTLSLLTLKPGLFTANGRDAAGEVWFDSLGVEAPALAPTAWLAGAPTPMHRAHASHKGSYGDVAVIGGAPGMTGAALLAGCAALHAGAGRVFVGLLDGGSISADITQPEPMFRPPDSLAFEHMALACGCGGGDAVRGLLPRALSTAQALVLDADALNAIAADAQLQAQLSARGRRGKPTVITPHPLEAARLLQSTAAKVQADRIASASELARRFECVCVLKGSGTVVAAVDEPPSINPTGSARLATAGTGDVLAGLIAARMAQGMRALDAAVAGAFEHGAAADSWPSGSALTASGLAKALNPALD